MFTRRMLVPIVVPIALLIIGTLGYRLIEGPSWSWLDALYMATITLTTVGYGETKLLSTEGRWFTIVYLLGGVFTLFFIATEALRSLVSGELQGILGRTRMERNLARISGHIVVCGYGRMGQHVCREFEAQQLKYVVIDRNEAVGKGFPSAHGTFIAGDITSDDVLLHAGVQRARALVTVATSDADNLYVTMSARLLNPVLHIVARAEDSAAEEKLRRGGANRVVSPYVIGGSRVAHAVLRPTVVDFIDLATRTGNSALQIEEIRVAAGSELAGATLAQRRLHELGVIVVAIKRPGGELVASPSGECTIESDCVLIVLGPSEQLERLETMASAR